MNVAVFRITSDGSQHAVLSDCGAISTTHSVEDMLGTVTLASRSGSTLFTPSCKN